MATVQSCLRCNEMVLWTREAAAEILCPSCGHMAFVSADQCGCCRCRRFYCDAIGSTVTMESRADGLSCFLRPDQAEDLSAQLAAMAEQARAFEAENKAALVRIVG